METQIKFSLGGGKRIRTADPLHAMQVLYQLSYTPEREKALYRAPKKKARGILPKFKNFVKSPPITINSTLLPRFPNAEFPQESAIGRHHLRELSKKREQ